MSAPAQSDPIGVATMLPDGTLVLDLRAEGPGGLLGDARFVYAPDHAQYGVIKAHLGEIAPGEFRPVPPWDN